MNPELPSSRDDNTRTQTVTRRRVLQGGAAATAVATASALSSKAAAQSSMGSLGPQPEVTEPPTGPHQVFQHGVASGDPLPDSVLLWTRVSSHPGDLPGKNQGTATTVTWEVAKDENFTDIVTHGEVTATPDSDMTVKPEASGLDALTSYFYRFRVLDGEFKDQVSPVGKTRTAPAAGASVDELRFALFSCANWEAGYFHAYSDMARRGDIDYALCVGDYIYEYPRGEYGSKFGSIRSVNPPHEIISLEDYRERYGQYRSDQALQDAHAVCPWIVTWDDHEVANDSWADGAENHSPEEGDYHARRDAAIQAYLEWLPIRATAFSEGGHIYRNFGFGDLLELNMLDLRTYRNQPVKFMDAKQIDDPNRTMLGSEQFDWLTKKLSSSSTKWNLIGNSVMISPVLIPPLDPQTSSAVTQLLGIPEQGMPYNFDQWDGFAAERRKVLRFLSDNDIKNTVWLTGDIHSAWACDVPENPGAYDKEGAIATEFVCTSVTSSNIDDILKLPEDNGLSLTAENAFKGLNHHVKYLDYDGHGYSVVQVTPEFVHTDWIFIQPDGKDHKQAAMFYGQSARARVGQSVELNKSQLDPANHQVH